MLQVEFPFQSPFFCALRDQSTAIEKKLQSNLNLAHKIALLVKDLFSQIEGARLLDFDSCLKQGPQQYRQTEEGIVIITGKNGIPLYIHTMLGSLFLGDPLGPPEKLQKIGHSFAEKLNMKEISRNMYSITYDLIELDSIPSPPPKFREPLFLINQEATKRCWDQFLKSKE